MMDRSFAFLISFILFTGTNAQLIAFVGVNIRYEISHRTDGLSDMTITTAFRSHPISNRIEGTNLWRMGFFGGQNRDGSGLRLNQQRQMLTAEQASQTALPGQNLTFVMEQRMNLQGIGPGLSFRYYCLEFHKNSFAEPDFNFQVGSDTGPAVFCRESDSTPSPPDFRKRALFTSLHINLRTVRPGNPLLPSQLEITATASPSTDTDRVTGFNLWRLGFFGSQTTDGSGEREGEISQLLSIQQRSQSLIPDNDLVFDVSRSLFLTTIGTGKEFPFICIEFAKLQGAIPDYLFLGSDEDRKVVVCQTSAEPVPSPDDMEGQTETESDLTEGRVVNFVSTNIVSPEEVIGIALLVHVSMPSTTDLTVYISPPESNIVYYPESVVIPAGRFVGVIPVTPIDDALATQGGSTVLNVRILPNEYYSTGPRSDATITILDNDVEPSLIAFAQTELNVHENTGRVVVTMFLNSPSQNTIALEFMAREVEPVSASGNVDYLSLVIRSEFVAGRTLLQVTIPIKDDTEREDVEDFVIAVDMTSLPENLQVVGQSFITVHIIDDEDCPNEYYQLMGMCYRLLDTLLSFDEARAVCQLNGADIASAATSEKNNLVSAIANGQRCWIGGERMGDDFSWLNGEAWDFTNWRKREPNFNPNTNKGPRACLETNFVRATLWNDHNCNAERTAVCETPAVPIPT